jgi:hypothetical protein
MWTEISTDLLRWRSDRQDLNSGAGMTRLCYLTAIAESRRKSSLREIDRRRPVLGETVRRSVQEVEDGEFKMIEPTPAN